MLIPDLSNPPWPEGEKVLERDVRSAVKRLLASCGFYIWDTEQGYRPEKGGSRVTPGLPDLYAVHPRKQIRMWLELKGQKTAHRQTEAQRRFQDYEVASGGMYVLGGWQDVADVLVGMGLAR